MKVEYINPFIEALVNVLSTMAQTEANRGKLFIKKEEKAKGDVTGVIGLVGNLAKGSLAISFPEAVILEIAGRMLSDKFEKIDSEIADMVGEITNMVTGGAKKILSEQGYKFEMAIPSTIVGKDHTIQHNTKGPVVIVPFDTDVGPFFMEVCLVSN